MVQIRRKRTMVVQLSTLWHQAVRTFVSYASGSDQPITGNLKPVFPYKTLPPCLTLDLYKDTSAVSDPWSIQRHLRRFWPLIYTKTPPPSQTWIYTRHLRRLITWIYIRYLRRLRTWIYTKYLRRLRTWIYTINPYENIPWNYMVNCGRPHKIPWYVAPPRKKRGSVKSVTRKQKQEVNKRETVCVASVACCYLFRDRWRETEFRWVTNQMFRQFEVSSDTSVVTWLVYHDIT